jgi:serine/threonine-protein kinase
MLTGVLPFRGESMAELMYKIANEPAPDLLEVRKDLPAQLAQVVARALAKKPDQRFQDGDAFARELRAVLAAPEPAPGNSGRTAAVAPPTGGADPNATVAMAAGLPAGQPDAAVHADNGFSKTLPPSGLPGYDAAENDRHTREAQPGPTSALHMSGAPEMPQAGGGKAGREP